MKTFVLELDLALGAHRTGVAFATSVVAIASAYSGNVHYKKPVFFVTFAENILVFF